MKIEEAAAHLATLDRVLIAAHEKPDGDALGSSLGLGQLLRDNGRQAAVLLPDSVPEKFRPLVGGDYLTALPPDWAERFDSVILVDCARASRAALGADMRLEALGKPVFNLDHHMDNTVAAERSFVDGSISAASELVYQLAERIPGWTISARAATLLVLGIVTDTGSFRFSNTGAATLRAAAALRECGAAWDEVMNCAFFSKPLRQQQFEAEMVRSCVRSALDGRFLYAVLPDELFARFEFDMRDGETVIELLREIAGVVIAALIYRRDGVYKLSLRSKDARFPVGPVARTFGGGGHQMAAGATVAAGSFAEVEALLLTRVTEILKAENAI